MLITNFAAGELSETLFGRTDLSQYYQGVSFLENFEVIPTGGIERRNGTKRVLAMQGEGRLIPFILDREESFLLYLIPNGIQAFETDGSAISVTIASGLQLYTAAQIPQVQYTQNYDTMILVHEDRYPLVLQYTASPGFVLKKVPISYAINVKCAENINAGDYFENDTTYDKYKYLTEEENYPRCATFFQGRLIFAGTKKNPQRIFAGEANNSYQFGTYTKFVTEKRNYIVVIGTLNTADNHELLVEDSETVKFSAPLADYIVDSALFPAGTKVEAVKRKTAASSDPSKIVFTDLATEHEGLTPAEENAINTRITNYDSWNSGLSSARKETTPIGTVEYGSYQIFFYWGVTCFWLRAEGISYDTAKKYEYGDNVYNLSTSQQLMALRTVINNAYEDYTYPMPAVGPIDPSAVFSAAEQWKNAITATMTYTFRGMNLTGNPRTMKEQMIAYVQPVSQMYIPLYTAEILQDTYPTADNGFTFEIASDMSDAIRWIAQNKNLLIGTETAEWVIPAGITATNVQAVLNSRYGSDRIQGTSIGDALCFFQSGRKALVEYYIPQQDNNFRANNMALLSKNMLHESAAFDFDFISAPYTKLFISREDGIVVALLYERGTGTFAWGRIRTSGRIKSVATVPGPGGYDDVYLIVERSGACYLEMLAQRRRSDDAPDAEVFLDSYSHVLSMTGTYTNDAVIYDETTNKTYPITNPPPDPTPKMWVGYPYTSRVRSMPVLANDRMKQNIIKTLSIRFTDSFLPKVRSVSMDEGSERTGNTETIGRKEPYSGIVRIPFPGVWDRDVFFELIHDQPTRCRVLAVNAEAN